MRGKQAARRAATAACAGAMGPIHLFAKKLFGRARPHAPAHGHGILFDLGYTQTPRGAACGSLVGAEHAAAHGAENPFPAHFIAPLMDISNAKKILSIRVRASLILTPHV